MQGDCVATPLGIFRCSEDIAVLVLTDCGKPIDQEKHDPAQEQKVLSTLHKVNSKGVLHCNMDFDQVLSKSGKFRIVGFSQSIFTGPDFYLKEVQEVRMMYKRLEEARKKEHAGIRAKQKGKHVSA